ncbi:glycosyltransferase family 4 protein [Candidatus Margulisiibacteriota bacterium]
MFNEIVLHVIYAFFFSMCGSLIITNLVKKYSVKWGLIDLPNHRKVHTVPIPRSGGLAIVLSLITANLLFQLDLSLSWRILLGTSIIGLLGFWDDKFGMRARYKLAGQLIIAWVTVYVFDISIRLFPIEILNQMLSVFWIVGITNALNLLDNMDGLSTGITIIAATFFLFFAVQSGQYNLVIIAVSLMGGCLGFLWFNFHRASIFMGDSGSMSLGYLLAVLGIAITVNEQWPILQFLNNRFGLAMSNTHVVTGLVPLLILGLPVFDTTLVTIFRRLTGRRISDPGKDHTSHRIVALSVKERTAVLILYLAASILGLGAVTLVYGRVILVILNVMLLTGVLVYGVTKLSSARVYMINRRLLNKLKRKNKCPEMT